MSLSYLLYTLGNAYTFIIFIYILLSWFPNKKGFVAQLDDVLGKICDPYLDLFRKFIPPIGGTLDVSPIIALFVLQFVVRLLVGILPAGL